MNITLSEKDLNMIQAAINNVPEYTSTWDRLYAKIERQRGKHENT